MLLFASLTGPLLDDELRAFNNAIAEFKRFEFDVPRPLLMDLRRLLHKSPMINTGSVMETIMVPAHWVMDGRVMQTVVDDSSDLPVTQLTRKRLLTVCIALDTCLFSLIRCG